ncbi:MAG: hypothetical protein ACYCQJ_13075 [Nitrososphaerales archaeon]
MKTYFPNQNMRGSYKTTRKQTKIFVPEINGMIILKDDKEDPRDLRDLRDIRDLRDYRDYHRQNISTLKE